MTNIEIITYSKSLLIDDEIKKFIQAIINEYKQPIVIRKDLENLNFYTTNKSRLYIIVKLKKVLGTIGVYLKNNKAILKRFYLKKSIRNKGYGRILFDKAIDFIVKSNIKIVELNCDTKKMRKAYSFYLKNRFKVIIMRPDGYATMRLYII